MTSSLLFLLVCACVVFTYRLGFNDAIEEARECIEALKEIIAAQHEMMEMEYDVIDTIEVNERNIIDPANRVN